jgi:hypothetical protein
MPILEFDGALRAGADSSVGLSDLSTELAGPPTDRGSRNPLLQPGAAPAAPRWLEPRKGGELALTRPGYHAVVHRDGSVSFQDDSVRPLGMGFSFDITDSIMRKAGIDPYGKDKLDFLDATRDFRLAMKKRERSFQLRESVSKLGHHLRTLWADEALSATRRRYYLFKLWDECAESGDEELLARSAQARATIVGFIRTRIPSGQPGSFSDAELERLNQERTSTARFAPYGQP